MAWDRKQEQQYDKAYAEAIKGAQRSAGKRIPDDTPAKVRRHLEANGLIKNGSLTDDGRFWKKR